MRIRSIPPITSTGKNRSIIPATLPGLAHMSIGRYMSERTKNRKEEEYDSWDITKHAKSEFNRKSKNGISTSIIPIVERKIDCRIELIDDYNEEGDFAVVLKFNEIEFLSDNFTAYSNKSNQSSYFIPLFYNNNNEYYLLLTTVGDIFEFEIVRDIDQCSIEDCFMGHAKKAISKTGEKEFCPNRLFRDEAYIPKLLEAYDSLSMNVVLKDNCVIVTYKGI